VDNAEEAGYESPLKKELEKQKEHSPPRRTNSFEEKFEEPLEETVEKLEASEEKRPGQGRRKGDGDVKK